MPEVSTDRLPSRRLLLTSGDGSAAPGVGAACAAPGVVASSSAPGVGASASPGVGAAAAPSVGAGSAPGVGDSVDSNKLRGEIAGDGDNIPTRFVTRAIFMAPGERSNVMFVGRVHSVDSGEFALSDGSGCAIVCASNSPTAVKGEMVEVVGDIIYIGIAPLVLVDKIRRVDVSRMILHRLQYQVERLRHAIEFGTPFLKSIGLAPYILTDLQNQILSVIEKYDTIIGQGHGLEVVQRQPDI